MTSTETLPPSLLGNNQAWANGIGRAQCSGSAKAQSLMDWVVQHYPPPIGATQAQLIDRMTVQIPVFLKALSLRSYQAKSSCIEILESKLIEYPAWIVVYINFQPWLVVEARYTLRCTTIRCVPLLSFPSDTFPSNIVSISLLR